MAISLPTPNVESDSITELKTTVENTWDNPILSARLSVKHDDAIFDALQQADGSTIKGRKRKRPTVADDNRDTPELQALQEQLDSTPLKCWGCVHLFPTFSTTNNPVQIRQRVDLIHANLQEFGLQRPTFSKKDRARIVGGTRPAWL